MKELLEEYSRLAHGREYVDKWLYDAFKEIGLLNHFVVTKVEYRLILTASYDNTSIVFTVISNRHYTVKIRVNGANKTELNPRDIQGIIKMFRSITKNNIEKLETEIEVLNSYKKLMDAMR